MTSALFWERQMEGRQTPCQDKARTLPLSHISKYLKTLLVFHFGVTPACVQEPDPIHITHDDLSGHAPDHSMLGFKPDLLPPEHIQISELPL